MLWHHLDIGSLIPFLPLGIDEIRDDSCWLSVNHGGGKPTYHGVGLHQRGARNPWPRLRAVSLPHLGPQLLGGLQVQLQTALKDDHPILPADVVHG